MGSGRTNAHKKGNTLIFNDVITSEAGSTRTLSITAEAGKIYRAMYISSNAQTNDIDLTLSGDYEILIPLRRVPAGSENPAILEITFIPTVTGTVTINTAAYHGSALLVFA